MSEMFEHIKRNKDNSGSEDLKGQIGGKVIYLEEINSTNLYALENSGTIEHGTVIVADAQTSGRGRKGRSWISPRGKGLYMTVLLKDKFSMREMMLLNIAASLSVYNVLKNMLDDKGNSSKLELKWPNDVLFNARKISGVLSERKNEVKGIPGIAVGIGVNVNHEPEDFPPEFESKPISFLQITGEKQKPIDIGIKIIGQFNKYYKLLKEGNSQEIIKEWVKGSPSSKGSRLRILSDHGEFKAISEGLDEFGFLKVRRYKDKLQRILSADIVTIRTE
ncbi:MAG: biotin--[acetyl-CoA-carboxylase] ligase [Acidobacteria bacterium]|nr:biotin--[acetyl-CoA-carboxylase] ligase [Acidobacteriota bacterium]